MYKIITITPREENSDGFFNIAPATEFIPEWYRLSSSNILGTNTELVTWSASVTTSTYKKCTPFFDALSIGYIVFLTADIEISRQDNGLPLIQYRTDRQIVSDHASEQWQGLPCPDGYIPYVYKWHNQFGLTVPKDYSLLFTSPINRFDLPFKTITGIVDCDTYDLSVHFPFFIKNNFVGIIEKGTPITQIIPIKRDSWKREYREYDFNRTKKSMEKFLSTIKRSYKNNYWHRKEYK